MPLISSHFSKVITLYVYFCQVQQGLQVPDTLLDLSILPKPMQDLQQQNMPAVTRNFVWAKWFWIDQSLGPIGAQHIVQHQLPPQKGTDTSLGQHRAGRAMAPAPSPARSTNLGCFLSMQCVLCWCLWDDLIMQHKSFNYLPEVTDKGN